MCLCNHSAELVHIGIIIGKKIIEKTRIASFALVNGNRHQPHVQWAFYVNDTFSGTHTIHYSPFYHLNPPFPPSIQLLHSLLLPPLHFSNSLYFLIVDNVIESINFPLTSAAQALTLQHNL